MKKLIALLLAGILCLSLMACVDKNNTGTSVTDEEYVKYLKYKRLINMLDDGNYDEALAYINSIRHLEDDRTNDTGSSSVTTDNNGSIADDTGSKFETTEEPPVTKPKERTVELTVDNWKDYFEIRLATSGEIRNSFGEFEKPDYMCWALFLKSDVAQIVTGMDDVAIEYSFTEGYYSWLTYNIDTKEFLLSDPTTKEDGFGYEADDIIRDTTVSSDH